MDVGMTIRNRDELPDAIDDTDESFAANRYADMPMSISMQRIKAELERHGWTVDEKTGEPRPKSDAEGKSEA
jgi:hypothetical protein